MNFEMVGKLSISKGSDSFAPYEEKEFDSGWINRRLIFNAQCGDNRHSLQVSGGKFKDEHNLVYVIGKSTQDDSGNRVKGEAFTIPFKERLTSPRLDEVADFRKYIVDLEEHGRRYKLQHMVEGLKEGKEPTEDELKDVGLEVGADLKAELEKSEKKHKDFISPWDYAEFIKKMIDSGKYANRKFFIRGVSEYSVNEQTLQVYENYVPQRIYLAEDDADEYSTGSFKILFGEDSVDDGSLEEKGRYYVNGHVMEYIGNQRKANVPVPVTISIVDNKENPKLTKRILSKFAVDGDDIKEYGVEVELINGAQRQTITEDMLTEDQKEDLACGLITMEDIRAELGGSVYGDRVRELKFIKPGRGFTSKGAETTAYTADDMVIKPLAKEDETGDLFEEEDDLFAD